MITTLSFVLTFINLATSAFIRLSIRERRYGWAAFLFSGLVFSYLSIITIHTLPKP